MIDNDHDSEPDLIPTPFDIERINDLELEVQGGPRPTWLNGEKGTWRVMPYPRNFFVVISLVRNGKKFDSHFECDTKELIIACLKAMNTRIEAEL